MRPLYTITNVGPVSGGEAFLLTTEGGAALVDTGFAFSAGEMTERVARLLGDKPLNAVLLTHSHYDHASGVSACRERWPGVKVYGAAYAQKVFRNEGARQTIAEMNANAARVHGAAWDRGFDEALSVDVPLTEGDEVAVGSLRFRVLETPGHTRDCLSFWCEEEGLLLPAETLGYPLMPELDLVVPNYLVGYACTLASIRRLAALKPRAALISHRGLEDEAFLRETFPKALYWAERVKDAVLAAAARELDEAGIIEELRALLYVGDIRRLQPEKAFALNAHYMVNMLLRECGDTEQEKRI